MRNLSIIICVVFFTNVHAQSIDIEVLLQQTVNGIEYGGNVMLEHKQWAVGMSYQKGITKYSELDLPSSQFLGLVFQMPIITCEKLALVFAPRVGFVGEQFFVVIPEVKLGTPLFRNIDLSLGTGMRYGKPSISLSLSTSLKNFNHAVRR
jgi:hypothetical protein